MRYLLLLLLLLVCHLRWTKMCVTVIIILGLYPFTTAYLELTRMIDASSMNGCRYAHTQISPVAATACTHDVVARCVRTRMQVRWSYGRWSIGLTAAEAAEAGTMDSQFIEPDVDVMSIKYFNKQTASLSTCYIARATIWGRHVVVDGWSNSRGDDVEKLGALL